MQSFFNVIKSGNAKSTGEKKIVVEYSSKILSKEHTSSTKVSQSSYEKLAESIINSAKVKSDEIIKDAYKKSVDIQSEAESIGYTKGYEKGNKEGYENGYDEGRKKSLEEVKQEAKNIKDNAEDILKSAKEQYENYLKQKEDNIKNLIVHIVSDILKKEIENKDTIINLIKESIKDSKSTKNFIIKCCSFHEEDFKNSISLWKQSLGFKAEIFILLDNSLEKGQIIIHKDNGKVEINIEDSIEKVKDIIMNS